MSNGEQDLCDDCYRIFRKYNQLVDQGDMAAAVGELERYDAHRDAVHGPGRPRNGRRAEKLTKKDKQIGRKGVKRARAVLAYKGAS